MVASLSELMENIMRKVNSENIYVIFEYIYIVLFEYTPPPSQDQSMFANVPIYEVMYILATTGES